MSKRKAKTISILDLLATSADEDKAAAWPESAVWNRKHVCPHCGGLDNIHPFGKSKRHIGAVEVGETYMGVTMAVGGMVALAKGITDKRLKYAGLVR